MQSVSCSQQLRCDECAATVARLSEKVQSQPPVAQFSYSYILVKDKWIVQAAWIKPVRSCARLFHPTQPLPTAVDTLLAECLVQTAHQRIARY
jgi:hypothetical protein